MADGNSRRRPWRTVRVRARRLFTDADIAVAPAVADHFRSPMNVIALLVAAVLFAVSWSTFAATLDLPVAAWPLCAALTALPVALAWSHPLVGWVVCLVAAAVIGQIAGRVNEWPWAMQVTTIIAMVALTVMTYVRVPWWSVPMVWVVTSLLFFVSAPGLTWVGWAVGFAITGVVVVLARLAFRSRLELERETGLKEQATQRSAVLNERARIARDLHDVVAHRMSMVVVQAESAPYRLRGLSPEVVAEFESIAATGREALQEVRQMLGVLRVEEDGAQSMPNPTVADIAALVASTRSAGVDVQAQVSVDPQTVGDATSLVAYRIVQESLANATRHAPGSSVVVAVQANAGTLEVSVDNSAPRPGTAPSAPSGAVGSGPSDEEGGFGITGMIERANAVGGSLSAAAARDGGFAVRAVLPLRSGVTV